MTVILQSTNVDSFCVATDADYDKWEAKGMAIKELEAWVATLERAMAEHESIDSRYATMALRNGRIKAAMVWFEERQDKVKEMMDVTLDNMAWDYLMQKGEVAAEGTSARLTPAPNVSQFPTNNGMVVASGSGLTWSPVQLAPSPIPEVLICNPSNTSVGPTPILTPVFITTATVSPSNTTSRVGTSG